MRRLGFVLSLLALALVAPACGGDDDDIDSAILPRIDSGPGGADASTIDGGGGGAAPAISTVSWAPAGACTAGTASDFTITITATDQDTAAAMLTFSGSATSCTGTITGDTGTLNCPNLASYPGTITVTDPEGNSDTQTFTIGICQSGSAP